MLLLLLLGAAGGECLPEPCLACLPPTVLPQPPPPPPAAGGDSWQMPEALRAAYDKAQHAAELRQPYEASVAGGRPADADLLAAYMAYVKAEERQGDPTRVQASPRRSLSAQPPATACLLPVGSACRSLLQCGGSPCSCSLHSLTHSPPTHPSLAHTSPLPCHSAGCVRASGCLLPSHSLPVAAVRAVPGGAPQDRLRWAADQAARCRFSGVLGA